jgi:FixJ family two-component response regulator
MATGGRLVYVVDDDLSFRTSVARLLRAAGYATETFGSAADFLDGPRDRSGCLLLDVHMPSMGGLDLGAALAARRAALPVVFVTGRADPSLMAAAEHVGAVRFLTKPVRAHELFEAIDRALERCDRRLRAG